jgi:catechol 2,3-dioxygenase-like lactoylglutathione lyase family enzyme
VRIQHLALQVRDPARSRRFYLDTLGLHGDAVDEDWGVRVSFADGFMLALIQGEPVPEGAIDRVHFGCRLPDAFAARAMRERLADAAVVEIEWVDEPDYVSVKVRDPDGYIVELAYE